MSKEIIINVTGEHSRIAIVEDGELVELYIENPENVRTIGDIYLGKVRRILPGIKAAFVDIGQKQDAFLHFSDLSDNLQDLLELSDGKVLDWASKPLTKAPKQDESGGSDLELETPEEQRAARRRRDLNRTHGKGRRGRGRKQDAKPEADAKPETEASVPSEPAKAQDAKRSEAKPEKTGQRRAERERSESRRGQSHAEQSRHMDVAPPEPPTSVDLPGAPPPLLPPDAVTPPPQDAPAEVPAAEAPAAETRSETDEQPARPKKRRGRRGGRGRNRERAQRDEQQRDDTQQQDSPTETQSEAQDADATSAEADAEQRSTKPSRSRGGRSRGRKSTDRDDASRDEPNDGAEAQEPASEESSPRRSTPARQEKRSRQPEAERVPEAKADEPKPKKKQKAASTPSRSSRFVIDLTSKPASKSRRVDRDDIEEEEEEEENKSSRNRRRSGRRRSGRGRSGASAKKSDGGTSDSGKSSDDGAGGDGSSSKGRSSRSGRDRGGRSGRSSSNGSSGGSRPETYLKQDQKLVVKITKEPISSKGPRVSTDVSLAGRFLVLIPQADYVAVSKKIESAKERRRLRALARSLLPEGFGLIVRTVAEERDAKALDTDLRLLLEKWRKIEDQLKEKPKPPKPLYEDVNMVSSIIRDLFSEDYDRIVVDDPKVHRNVKNYVQAVAPQMAANVVLHKSKEHVFRTYKIERDVRAAFETRVPLPGGGYLFIEHTEAMHVVDVNSGRAGRGLSQEENSLRVNLESAKEIAKQLRLRDLGGIICVDFIDMRSHSARQKVYDELKKQFRKDRAVTKLLPMSDFGVVEITRQRLRPSITTTTNVDDLPPLEDLPLPEPQQAAAPAASAEPAGPAPTATEVMEKLERWLSTYRAEVQEQHRKRPILLRVHPFLAAYLDRGIPSTLTRWRFRTRLKFRLDVDEAADPLGFAVLDEKSGKNLTRKYDVDGRAEA
ncbi:MAG: Rne/Rng family ribonuclease [Rhodothermales bacterium]